jgi:hypothetical protein
MITFGKLGNFGRLGNQLFQIASTVGIAVKNGTDYAFPSWNYKEDFAGPFPLVPNEQFQTYQEISPYYTDIFLDASKHWSLEGYFQSWKYFDHCKELIHNLFYFEKTPIDGIAIHVRRGDYLNLRHIHPILEMDYYKTAMDYFHGEKFTVFSDDIEWCKENLNQRGVSYSTSNSLNPMEDFRYMSSHKGFIIANSSYSWWAAYLSGSRDIIAPSKYVIGENRDDRIPGEWKKI